MIRTIRVLAVAGLIAVALSAWLYHALIFGLSEQGYIALQVVQHTSELLSFSAGLLALTLTIPRRQRPWTAALLVSLILNGYWSIVYVSGVRFALMPPLLTLGAEPYLVEFLVYALVSPATPALLALGYTIRAATRAANRASPAPQAPQPVEEATLDITIEPIEPLGSGPH